MASANEAAVEGADKKTATENGSTVDDSENKDPPSDLEKRIIDQVEYYFGDINLPRDRFLLEEMKKDEGWVPMATMMKFNRLKSLCGDTDMIVAALKKSETGLLEISVDCQKIRRSLDNQLPENSLEYWEEVKSRTVYVKGFDSITTTLDELKAFFSQFGTVKNVLMRRVKGPDRVFKGSVFVTYSDKETCKAFIDNDTKDYKGVELIKLMQLEYWKQKNQREKERRKQEKEAKAAKRRQDNKKPVKEASEQEIVQGQVARLAELPSDGVTVEIIKATLNKHGSVGYVTYTKGADTALVRFGCGENGAKKTLEKAQTEDGKLKLGDAEVSWEVLVDDEEKQYWKDYAEQKQKAFEKKKGGGGRGRKRKPDQQDTRDGNRSGRQNAPKKIKFKNSDDEGSDEKSEAVEQAQPETAKTEEVPVKAEAETE